MSEGGGAPRADLATPANVPAAVLAAVVDRVVPVNRPRGRPRKRPDQRHADQADDHPTHRRTLRERGITPRIARPGVGSSERLGRHRWVGERTRAWLDPTGAPGRRVRVRDERRADRPQAFLDLGCALICWTLLQ